jgi:hypothetical protein
MEQLEQLKNWLMGFPLWGESPPAVDITGAAPGDCGLFPLGMEVLEHREDVQGNALTRLRQEFLLRRSANRGEDAAAWLLAFQQWAQENAATAPVFGDRQRLFAQKGRLRNPAQTGLGTYEVTLTIEYVKEKHHV